MTVETIYVKFYGPLTLLDTDLSHDHFAEDEGLPIAKKPMLIGVHSAIIPPVCIQVRGQARFHPPPELFHTRNLKRYLRDSVLDKWYF